MSGGLLSINSTEIIGGSQSQYSGSFSQTGGSNVTNLLSVGASGNGAAAYSLSGASQLSAQYEYIGSYSQSGSFTQSGGTHTVTNLYVGSDPGGSGTYTLTNSGQLAVGSLIIGNSASGSFTQSGGTNAVSASLILAQFSDSSGTYNLNGGLLSLVGLGQGSGVAKFKFSGGTFQAETSFSTSVPMNFPLQGNIATFDTNGSTLTLNGALSGPGGPAEDQRGHINSRGLEQLHRPHDAQRRHAGRGQRNDGSATARHRDAQRRHAGRRPGRRHDRRPGAGGSGPHTIAPGAALSSGYGTLNLIGGLTTNANTTLSFNLRPVLDSEATAATSMAAT